ncbi:hypothetical protein AN8575.2 [Aspergillus nidulans FGSC A4]|nr:hypothetical protein AN8575.2 [Aspergillus nidulans FGSC A4]|eukprot:XP_681844.1 hypothetical protein AN8575.2 [Aspergillus nidulans FGSC A4]
MFLVKIHPILVKGHAAIDLGFLEELFNNETLQETEECGVIEPLASRRVFCAQFLRSPQLEAFCEQYNTSTLAEIHISFCNKDRISAILQKQRLLAYPNGQDIDGVIFLQQSNQHIKDYIQETYHDSEGTMVICAYREQIQLLAQLSSFEVDMSYKRIRTKDINEVLFATFLPDQCKVITLLRVFTSDDSTRGYYLLFKRVFTLVQKLTQTPVLFDPIHGSGIYGIIMDMDSKLYTGLGQYLSEVDPQRRDITWQLERIIVFCQVHFQRSILKAIGTRSHGTPLWGLMMSLLDCNSEVEYDELLELLIENEAAAVRDWAVQKKSSIIKAGLNKACSKIQPYHFSELRNYTNAVKQAQQKSNATCKYLTLVEAITNSAKLDQSDILQYQNLTRFNIHHSYRTSEMEDNYLRHMSREESRSRYPRQNSGDDGSVRSSQNLRRTASEDALTLEQRRQELELRKLEADIRKQELDIRKQEADIKQQEVDIRLQQLKNDQLELDLMERRARIQDLQAITGWLINNFHF